MYEEALDSIQRESHQLTQDNKQLKDKVTQLDSQKDNPLTSLMNRQVAGGGGATLAPEIISMEVKDEQYLYPISTSNSC